MPLNHKELTVGLGKIPCLYQIMTIPLRYITTTTQETEEEKLLISSISPLHYFLHYTENKGVEALRGNICFK